MAEVAKMHGKSPEETAMDLIIADSTRVGVAYFLMNEDNVKKQVAQPWVSFGSDEGSYNPADTVFMKSQPHPRAYGNFARVLGHYSRDEKVLTLQQAIYQLAKLPVETLKIKKRGELKVGNYADIIIFDPAKVNDLATYDKPAQLATGMIDVFVNGKLILKKRRTDQCNTGTICKGTGIQTIALNIIIFQQPTLKLLRGSTGMCSSLFSK